ncbi:MAG TPA: hypothetical protein VK745_01390 [Polyangiaceae bacterium]|nr:hypothetical protein [Polyangiaceae bacterium]
MHFKHSFQMGGLLFVSWALATGCTVSSTTTDSCASDSTVACTSGTGYSCSGTQTPTEAVDSTLSCGAAVTEPNGDLGYCCAATTTTTGTDTCTADSNVACDGSSGYTCTSTDAPNVADPTLDCGAGVAGSAAGTLAYCCVTIPTSSSCTPDETVTGCTGGSFGFSCTSASSVPTDIDPSLDCSDPTPGDNGASLYCCVSFSTTASTCMPDETVDGCTGDSYGFSCTGTDTPTDAQASLTCSDPAAGPSGESLYCCTNG